MSAFDAEVTQTKEYMESPRFADITRIYSARMVAEQKGTIDQDYTVARQAAEGFYARLRELFADGKSITTYGPYSPGQAVAQKRAGIEGIYLGGWATSAKGSINEDPGPDLASYPLSQVPDEAAAIVREAADPDCNVIFGTVVDDTLGDSVRVTVIATGFDDGSRAQSRPRPSERERPSFGRERASEPRRERPSFDSGDALDVPSFLKDS